MKITIDIDCTPAEAREFFGLPDIKPLQDEWLRQVGEQMQANAQNFSPEAMVKSWAQGAGGGAEWLNAMMAGFAKPGGGA
ncbi:MAG TPA: hypothetical protein ENK83_04785 [Aliiroseovarius sp.]|nr:hypothetical protein [Aliiroseovarius sp.]